MSADNCIAILVNADTKGRKQYRVAYAQAIENIVYEPDYPDDNPVLNRHEVMIYFGGSCPIINRKAALSLACQMKQSIINDTGVVEYGIQILDYRTIPFPS